MQRGTAIRWRQAAAVITAVGSLIASFVATGLFFSESPTGQRPLPTVPAPVPTEVQARLDSLEKELAALQRQIKQLSPPAGVAPPAQEAVAAQLTRIEQSLAQTQARIGAVESTILTDPAKALQVPLLGREVADLSGRLDASTESLRRDTDRVYDLLKNSLIALAIGVLTAVVGSIFIKRG